MKLLLFTCCLLLIISCADKKTEIKKPIFLIGNWIRVNDKKGSSTFEKWNSELKGIGYTLKEKDTTFKEILSIINIKDTLTLKVENVNKTPTYFKFTKQTDTSFICENLQNKFPKKIKYYLENDLLKAIVSANKFKIEFIFEREL
ncbi:MAG: hypothetical protein ABJH82_08725 [Polaribacter sp.]|uniref:hypothetical protein n=1 Tax=Polaribacter sp. TaxID=1920175 RepID=UPI0032678374